MLQPVEPPRSPRVAGNEGKRPLAAPPTTAEFNAALDAELLAAIDAAEARSLPLSPADLPIYGVLRYHLGFVNASFAPERSDPGKRIRPRLCVLACLGAGGTLEQSIHAAAAIELLHNFTLIHDDIQDHSPMRRHRETVWQRWGIAQAINAGDAMFAVAQLALNRSLDAGVAPATVLALSNDLLQTTLRIVEGQALDLGFEQRADVHVDEYLRMIGGKTAEITRLACRAGGAIAGADARHSEALAEFGFALGVGFQLRDDLLGVWGDPRETGKAAADDIRRRKKGLPALMLLERASAEDRACLDTIYAQHDVPADDVEAVLALLTRYEVRDEVQRDVREWHDRAGALLDDALPPGPARDALAALVESLEARAG